MRESIQELQKTRKYGIINNDNSLVYISIT